MSSDAPPRTAPDEATRPAGGGLRGTVLVGITALLAVAAVGLDASAPHEPLARYVGEPGRRYELPTPDPTRVTGGVATPTPSPPRTAISSAFSEFGPILVQALLLLGALAALLLVIAVIRRARRLTVEAPQESEDVGLEAELTVDDARTALRRARADLASVQAPADAIVTAWLTLERAVTDAGITRRPSETTVEYVHRVLGDLPLDEAELGELAHLYRRAMFDAHRPREADRKRASALLDALSDALARSGR